MKGNTGNARSEWKHFFSVHLSHYSFAEIVKSFFSLWQRELNAKEINFESTVSTAIWCQNHPRKISSVRPIFYTFFFLFRLLSGSFSAFILTMKHALHKKCCAVPSHLWPNYFNRFEFHFGIGLFGIYTMYNIKYDRV